MKKNFFKKLSFVMALALLISCIAPAAGVFAAAKPVLSSTSKVLHLSGEPSSNEYDFWVKNKQTGWKYAWSSSNKNVAVVDNMGLTTAVGVGTAKVSVKITKAGKAVATLTSKVTVLDNIATVTVANPNEKALKVNEEYDFNRNFKTLSGSTTKTSSITRWTVEGDKATVVADTGVFKATEAGEYKVTATAFQSSYTYGLWTTSKDDKYVLDTDVVTVKVVPSITEVKQADVDTVTVTFDSPMTDADKNLSVYQLVGATEVKQVVKEVKMDDTKKVASVSLYVPFTTGATYVIKYTDMESKQFVAATAKAEDVASLQVTTATAVVNAGTDIAVKLFNKDGVDITTTDLLNRVSYASSNERTYLTGKNLTIFTKGDTTTVTATFHTYKYDPATGTELGNVTGTSVVTGVDAASTVIGGSTAWSINTTGSANLSSPTHTVAAEDANLSFYVKLKQTTGTVETTVDNTGVNASKFKFTSSDESVLMIYNSGALYTIKAGVVNIVVTYDDKVVDAIPVTVSPKRAAATFTVDKNVVSLSNAAFGDTAEVKLTLKDQLGADFALANTNLEKLAGSPASVIGSLDVANKKVTFNATGATEGTYTYKVTANGFAQIITVTVTTPSSATASYYRLALSSNAVDLKVDTTKDYAENAVTVSLFGYASNNIKTSTVTTAGAGYEVTVTNPDGTPTIVGADGKYALTSLSGSAIVKAKVGTYKVTVIDSVTKVVKDIVYFTVTDTQTAGKVDTVNTLVSDKTDLLQAIQQCFKFTLDGSDITTSVTLGDYIGDAAGTSVFVKTVKYTKTLSDNKTLEYTITVNSRISKK